VPSAARSEQVHQGIALQRFQRSPSGFDIGSSSVKGAVIDLDSGAVVASDFSARGDGNRLSHPGWAEQDRITGGTVCSRSRTHC
jgi:hypothetical protein